MNVELVKLSRNRELKVLILHRLNNVFEIKLKHLKSFDSNNKF